jgi:hypothetical protein
MTLSSKRGDQFLRALIGEYEELAKYYKTVALAKRASLKVYAHTAEETETIKQDIQWHFSNANEFQHKADQLKGDDNGIESKDLRSTGVPSELSGQSEQFAGITCTTVL